jgi:hypothetical protein
MRLGPATACSAVSLRDAQTYLWGILRKYCKIKVMKIFEEDRLLSARRISAVSFWLRVRAQRRAARRAFLY